VNVITEKYYIPQKIDILHHIRNTSNFIKQKIDKTIRISNNLKNRQTLSPIYRWGQNDTHILVNVKFGHRWGSPGCIDIWNKTMSIDDGQNLSFSAMGINGQMPLVFALGINLLEKIDSS
jgi:hypothetical protein